MSTEEQKIKAEVDGAEAIAKADLAKVPSLWARWEPYVIGVLCFALGFIVRGHL